MTYRRILALILLFALAATIHPAAAAGSGSVSVAPASSNVGVGGTVNVDVIIDPPSSELSIWIVKVAYNPSVVQVTGCTPLNVPVMPNLAGAAGCDTQDTNADLIDDTAVAFGGWVQNVGGTPHGFNSTQTVATFTFQAVGVLGQQSPLNVSVLAFLGPNGETNTPSISNGTIHIVNAPSVTAAPTPTVAPVGGSVELLSATEGRTFASSEPMLALAIGALFAAGCIAFVASRRIIGR
jgi:hypothetical protein